MTDYFVPFLELARQNNMGFVLDTNTWRANPEELAQQYAELRHNLPNLKVFGGCCGTTDM